MKKITFLSILVFLMSVTVSVALADHPTPLGGLTLQEYCQSEGYAGVTMTKDRIGPNAAFNNWRCVTTEGNTHPFSMEQACKWQYSLRQVQSHPDDPDDAWTWVCYSVAHN
jgi:hypothetical protein